MSNTIVFVKFKSFSHVNVKLLEVLKKQFPDKEIVEIDIWKTILSNKYLLITLIFHGILYNHTRILKRYQDLIDSVLYTPFAAKTIQNTVKKKCGSIDVLFSIQTQSFFNACVPGVPHFVYTDHTERVNFNVPEWNKKKSWGEPWIRMESKIYHEATLNFTWSEHVRKSIISEYGVSAERVIKIGVGPNIICSDTVLAEERYKNNIILFVGINWERKGGLELVKAFKLISEKLPNARLRIVGCNPDINFRNIEIVGRITLEQVKTEMQNASIFCMPTRSEPFGIAVVEAMYSGLPVITSNVEAMPEIVVDGETGILVPPYDSVAISHALFRLLQSPELCQAMGIAGRKRVRNQFSWGIVGETMCREIRNALTK